MIQIETIRLMVEITSHKGWLLHHLNVKSTFMSEHHMLSR
jgi:hypothetical protein